MQKYDQLKWTDEIVSRFWDYESQFQQRYFTYQYGDTIVNELKPFLLGRKKILDFGCGTGHLVPHLLELGGEVCGADFSENSIKVVNERFKSEPLFRGAWNPRQEQVLSERYDAIVIVEVFEHLDDDYLQITIDKIKSYLNEGGVLIVTVPNDENLTNNENYCPSCDKVYHRWQHIRSWSKGSLGNFLTDQGMSIKSMTTCNFSLSFKKRPIRTLYKYLTGRLWRLKKKPHLYCVATINVP